MIKGKDERAPTALVVNIQRMSTEDGPGIRTTVFFKGCSLRCTWCHNPETISPKPQIQWMGNRCIGCLTCVNACPVHALELTRDGMLIDRELCDACGICTEECPSTAMEMLGKTWGLEDLIEEVAKDRAYFENSGGGITASGGEPTLQAPFVAAFFRKLNEMDIHTTLDTCGMCSKDALYMVLPYTDLVLFDIKEIDPKRHEIFTGHSNARILENVQYIREYMKKHDRPSEMWIRTPIIPDATATHENIGGIGRFIAANLGDVVSRWELCSFNNMCVDKYERLGINWQFKGKELLTREFMGSLARVAEQSGVDPDIVIWTGLTKLEKEDREDQGGPKLRLVKSCNLP
ncbi:MAG TPA: glycyl-radical enzyme activating protein [Deltaproteobacteria bacterium]|nr:glycyl-radical enzyme activating protein [Deltaproteobacteria bacterium]